MFGNSLPWAQKREFLKLNDMLVNINAVYIRKNWSYYDFNRTN